MARDNPNDRVLRRAAARSEIKRAFQAESDLKHAERVVRRKEVHDTVQRTKNMRRWPYDPSMGPTAEDIEPIFAKNVKKAWQKFGKKLYKAAGSPAGVPEEASLSSVNKALGGVAGTRKKLEEARRKK